MAYLDAGGAAIIYQAVIAGVVLVVVLVARMVRKPQKGASAQGRGSATTSSGAATVVVTWYVKTPQGSVPMTEDALRTGLYTGSISPEEMVWREGIGSWVAARDVGSVWSAEQVEQSPVFRP